MKQLRVTMVIPLFKPLVGGAEKQAELLGKTLIKKGLRLNMITSKQPGVPHKLPDDPFSVKRVGIPGLGFISDLIFAVRVYFCLIFTSHDTVFHIHQAGLACFAAVLAATTRNTPIVVKCSSSGAGFDLNVLANKYFMGSLLAKFIAKKTTFFIAINKEVESQLIKWGVKKRKIINIPNGVKIPSKYYENYKNDLRDKLNLCRNDYIILGVGSLRPQKNFATLIEALSTIKDIISFKMIFLGAGPLEATLKKQTVELGLKDRIDFIGKVTHNLVHEYLQTSDLFVLPSLTEGLSNALLEAMASSLPCIVSDIPGNLRAIAHNKNGLCFPVGNSSELGKSICRVREDNQLSKKLAINAADDAKNHYNIDKIAVLYINLYKIVIRKKY